MCSRMHEHGTEGISIPGNGNSRESQFAYLGYEAGHLIAVELVFILPIDIDGSHLLSPSFPLSRSVLLEIGTARLLHTARCWLLLLTSASQNTT